MMRIDDEKLMAYVDGELDAVERAPVEAALAADPDLRARADAHRALRAAVAGAYAGVAREPVPEQLRAVIRPSADVVDLGTAKALRALPAKPRPWRQWAAIAATLVVGVLAGRLSDIAPAAPVIARDGRLEAHGALALALETEVAGSGAIGLTFRRRGGDYCRTFNAQGLAGVACRDEDRWAVSMALAAGPEANTDYRMAAAGMPREVLELAETMIDGEPLDARAEAAARAAGWQD